MSEPIHYPGITSCGCPYIKQPDPARHWKDCHYRLNSERDAQQAEPECGNCFEGKSDMDHVCRKCGGSGKAEPVEPAPAQDEREAFEAEARKLLYVLDRETISGEYIVPDTENAWQLWQARATHPAQTEQQPQYGRYETRPAEAVAGIAMRQLGDQRRWVEIRDLNAHAFPDIGPHDYYPVGTVLTMPAAPIAQTAPQQNVDAGLLGRIDAAIKAFTSGKASMHVPPEPTDVDMVLGECWQLVKGIIAAPQPEQSGLVEALEELLAGTGTSPGANKRYGKARAALDAYRAALSANGAAE